MYISSSILLLTAQWLQPASNAPQANNGLRQSSELGRPPSGHLVSLSSVRARSWI